MSTASRSLSTVLLAFLLVAFALPALGVEEPETTTTGATDTTVASDEEEANVPPPAVSVPPTAADETTPDWTYRYLIPTLLALAVVVVIATTVQYFVRVVRNRYKVVE